MKLARYYSHLNGYEWIQHHQPLLWQEIVNVINSVDASACRTKVSGDKTNAGKLLYSPTDLNKQFDDKFASKILDLFK